MSVFSKWASVCTMTSPASLMFPECTSSWFWTHVNCITKVCISSSEIYCFLKVEREVFTGQKWDIRLNLSNRTTYLEKITQSSRLLTVFCMDYSVWLAAYAAIMALQVMLPPEPWHMGGAFYAVLIIIAPSSPILTYRIHLAVCHAFMFLFGQRGAYE